MNKTIFVILSIMPFVAMAQSVPTLVADIAPGPVSSNPQSTVGLGSETIIFQANGTSQTNLYRFTSTAGVTQVTGTGGLYSPVYATKGPLWSYGVVNNRVYFYGQYLPVPPSTAPSGGETYNAASTGTPFSADSGLSSYDNSTNVDFQTALMGDKLYLWGRVPGGHGICYIGPSGHITLAATFNPLGFTSAAELTASGTKLFFIATMSGSGGFHDLQMFDPGTSVFSPVTIPGVAGDPQPLDLHGGDNNTLYFSANTASEGRELYSYSSSGVLTKLTSLNGLSDGVYNNGTLARHYNIIKFGNAVYFAGNDGTNGFELMKYDLTTATATLVKDINPAAGSSRPCNFYAFDDKLYFSADDGTHGHELWVTDGTPSNTMMVADINPGPGSSNPTSFCSMGGKIYFSADNGSVGIELFSFSGSSFTGIGSSLESGNNVVAFPNPSGQSVTIEVALDAPTNFSVVITDMQGKEVYKSEEMRYVSGKVDVVVPMQSCPRGVYLYGIVSDKSETIATGKVMRD